jgi:hypothetical protein
MAAKIDFRLLILLVLTPACGGAAELTDCEHSGASSAESPDKRWVATVQEEVCDAGGVAAAGVVVDLATSADVTHSQRIFSMAVRRSRDEWPKVLWKSATRLELWVPNRAAIGMQKTESQGIQIELKYCGDNPQERAQLAQFQSAFKQWMSDTTAWVQRRKLDPSLSEPKPKRPVEPRFSPDSCANIGGN